MSLDQQLTTNSKKEEEERKKLIKQARQLKCWIVYYFFLAISNVFTCIAGFYEEFIALIIATALLAFACLFRAISLMFALKSLNRDINRRKNHQIVYNLPYYRQ